MDIPSYKIENVLKNYAQHLIKNGRSQSAPRAASDSRRMFSFDGKLQDVINQISEKIINEAKELEAQSRNNDPELQGVAENTKNTGSSSRKLVSKKKKTIPVIAAGTTFHADPGSDSEPQDAA